MHRLGTPPAPSRTGWPVAPPHWPPRTANPRPGRCTRTVPQASGTRGVWGRHVGSVAAHRYRSSGAQVRGPRAAGSSVRSVYTVLRLALDGVVRDGLVAKNAAAVVKRLGVARREARHTANVDVTALLNAADGLRCCGRAASSKPPNGCTRVISGPTADSYSPRSSGHRSNRATCCGYRRHLRPYVRRCCTRGGRRSDWDARTKATGQVTNRTGRLAAVTAMTPGKHRQALTRLGRIFVVEPGDQFLLDTVRFYYSTRQADRYGYRCRRNDQPKRKIEEPSLQQQRRQHWPERTPHHPLPISLFHAGL